MFVVKFSVQWQCENIILLRRILQRLTMNVNVNMVGL